MEIRIDQILFQIINFGVVLGGLTFLLWKPVTKVLEERAKKAEDAEKAFSEAQKKEAELEEIKQQVKKKAEKEAQAIVAEAKKDAEKVAKDIVAKTKEEMKQEKAKLEKAWQEEKKSLMTQMQGDFTKAVFAVVERVLGEEVDAKKHDKLVKQSLSELQKTL